MFYNFKKRIIDFKKTKYYILILYIILRNTILFIKKFKTILTSFFDFLLKNITLFFKKSKPKNTKQNKKVLQDTKI